MPRTTIADTAASLLADHRALASEDLGRLVAARGVTRSKHPAQAVSRALGDDRRFRRLSDGRWAMPAQLLNGTTLTHRLTTAEATEGVLALTPDLAPIVALGPDGLLLPDGRQLTFLWDGDARDATDSDTDAALEGPPGWLADCSAGKLVHARVTGALLRVELGAEPRPGTRLAVRRIVEAARMRLLEQEEVGGFLLLPPTVSLERAHPRPARGRSRSARAPVAAARRGVFGRRPGGAPQFRGLAGNGLGGRRRLHVVRRDDIDDLDDTDDDLSGPEAKRALAEAFDLAPAEADGLEIVLGAYELAHRLGGIDSTETNAGLAHILGLPGIARVLAVKAWTDPDFEPFVAAIAAAAGDRDAAGARFVLGACAEARDDVVAAERLFRSALDADPDHPLALVEVARYETDRGDYASALRHLRAARIPADESERAWLEGLARPAVPKVGRNEPCPCGSGRKYKACHLDAPGEIASVEPGKALQHKLEAWLSQPNMQRVGDDVLREIGGEVPGSDSTAPVDPMLTDIILFDRGGLRRFLDVRGVLLPAAERSLGSTWLTSRRSLFEVQAVRPRTSVTLRDLRSGDGVVELGDRSIPGQVQPLDLLLTRLLPDGLGGLVAFDGVLVPRLQRRHVLDLLDSGDGLDLLRWIVEPAPSPRLANTEGEPIQLMTVVYRLVDPVATSAALEAKLESRGDGRFDEMVVRHGQDWIRGSITVEGDRATIDANSAKRAARLERTLLKAAPGARLIRREERGIEEAVEEERAKGPAAEPIDIASHPELAQAMEAFMKDAEIKWVDEHIPALGGMTPREALADPVARPELEAMLDDMAWQQRRPGGGHLMDPTRVRALLGIRTRNS